MLLSARNIASALALLPHVSGFVTNSSKSLGYSYLGCYIDDAPGGRLLPKEAYDNSSNTNDLCQAEAQQLGYVFFGTEYQSQCFLGNSPPPSSYKANEAHCTYSCAGDATEVCGGVGGYLSVYYNASIYSPGTNNSQPANAPVTVMQAGNYKYIGCYSEATSGRALSGLTPSIPVGGNTVESCEASCQGYTYFGVEYSNECYCGNTINSGSVDQPSSDILTNGCSMLCSGNSMEYCGGSNRLDVYQISGELPVSTTATSVATTSPTVTPGTPTIVPSAGDFSYIGCYTDSVSNRALTGLTNPVSGSMLTVEACAAACNGYTFFGVEYSDECYCGNSMMGGSTLAAGGNDPSESMCDMTCDGDTSEYCGGPNRLNTYQFNASLASASPTLSSASPTATPTGPMTVKGGVGFSYLGCYSDSVSSRALTGLSNPGPASQNTVEQCASECAGFTYFGVEYGAECYCGNSLMGGSALVAGDTPEMTGCDMTCSGNALEFCGGSNRLNLYDYVAIVTSAMPSSSAASSTLGASSNATMSSMSSVSPVLASSASSTISSGFMTTMFSSDKQSSSSVLPTSNASSIASATSMVSSSTASLSSFISSSATSLNSTASSVVSSSGISSFGMMTLTSMMSSSTPSSTISFPSSSANASSPAYTCLCV